MIIKILTEGTITEDLFFRPLSVLQTDSYSDFIIFTNTYSGNPINHFKWIKAIDILGNYWIGKTISEFESGSTIQYEWATGNIPDSHILHKKTVENKNVWE
jgi:hypothetical protein